MSKERMNFSESRYLKWLNPVTTKNMEKLPTERRGVSRSTNALSRQLLGLEWFDRPPSCNTIDDRNFVIWLILIHSQNELQYRSNNNLLPKARPAEGVEHSRSPWSSPSSTLARVHKVHAVYSLDRNWS